jgi:hypothetical protein
LSHAVVGRLVRTRLLWISEQIEHTDARADVLECPLRRGAACPTRLPSSSITRRSAPLNAVLCPDIKSASSLSAVSSNALRGSTQSGCRSRT